MTVFRPVKLPMDVGGLLLLHSMPGRYEPLELVWQEIGKARIECMVSLVSVNEVHEKSPEYAKAIIEGNLPCDRLEFPVTDWGVPDDSAAFFAFACDLAERLCVGQRLLIHCGAGIGRTGVLAICILLALGEPPENAKQVVSAAGSSPETEAQCNLVAWYASQTKTIL